MPAVSHRVWLANKQNQDKKPINLRGIAIGNGLTNPEIQFAAYADFALDNKLINQAVRPSIATRLSHSVYSATRSTSLILLQLYDSMKFWSPVCTWSTRICNGVGWSWLCALGGTFCQMTDFVPILAVNPEINVYDITKKCEGPLCYDFENADK